MAKVGKTGRQNSPAGHMGTTKVVRGASGPDVGRRKADIVANQVTVSECLVEAHGTRVSRMVQSEACVFSLIAYLWIEVSSDCLRSSTVRR